MHKAFEVHILNADGKHKARALADAFQTCLAASMNIVGPDGGREMAIVVTKLEEACFFAKKAMAQHPDNQEAPKE